MGGEVLIYGYGLICLSMLIFNLIYAAHLRSDAKRTVKRTGRIAALAAPLLEGGGPAPACLEGLSRRLERAGNLLALDEWLRTLEPERAELFFSRAAPLFGRLADASTALTSAILLRAGESTSAPYGTGSCRSSRLSPGGRASTAA